MKARHLFHAVLIILWIGLSANAQETILNRLAALQDVVKVEALQSSVFKEKYLLWVRQQVDWEGRQAGVFLQRVIVGHVGTDRPTVIVTEGYGAKYALRETYTDEVSSFLQANTVVVEHRYFLESQPDTLNWTYLTTKNAAADLHHVRSLLASLYPHEWVSTGISKGGQTALLYRTWFPDDVVFSVPYVAPLNRAPEDGRHEEFLRNVGTRWERNRIRTFLNEVLERRPVMVERLRDYALQEGLTFRITWEQLLDFCVLEYPFAFWQWGRQAEAIPARSTDDETLFNHLVSVAGPDYFAAERGMEPFFVQAATEMGYYGYDTQGLHGLSFPHAEGYLTHVMLPDSLGKTLSFNQAAMYDTVYRFLQLNDPRIIFIYGEVDPWSATRVPDFPDKNNRLLFIAPRGDHSTRIRSLPPKARKKVLAAFRTWLDQ
ncbi:MAG: aminopeptidase [Tannerellaceae bacterium]|nr:aminopeptidase [Tannerellaceae bacterium]